MGRVQLNDNGVWVAMLNQLFLTGGALYICPGSMAMWVNYAQVEWSRRYYYANDYFSTEQDAKDFVASTGRIVNPSIVQGCDVVPTTPPPPPPPTPPPQIPPPPVPPPIPPPVPPPTPPPPNPPPGCSADCPPECCMTDGGPESEKCVCDALDKGLAAITDALNEIDSTLEKMVNDSCTVVDDCKDEIIQLIDDHYRTATKSCDECKSDLEHGLAGTVEYAVACSGACISEIKHECESLQDDGSTCSTCKCKPCVCTGLECVQVDPDKTCEEEKPKKFVGWCNYLTGIVIVTEEGAGAPGPNFVPYATADTEQVALLEAQQSCSGPQLQSPPDNQQFNPHIPAGPCTLLELFTGNGLQSLSQAVDAANISGGTATAIKQAFELNLGGIGALTPGQMWSALASWMTAAPSRLAEEFAPTIAQVIGCGGSDAQGLLGAYMAVGNIQKVTGTDLKQFLTRFDYGLNSFCRRILLPPDQAVIAYLANAASYDQADASHAIHGVCKETLDINIRALRSKPLPLHLAVMRRREYINETQYHESMRELGYLEPVVRDNLFKITEQVPTLSDIIRLMVRDADDEQLVQQLQMDTQFDRKYGKQLRKWSEDQGVPELFAKYAWRAHWQIPSPGQLFEFWHRLRYNPQFGGKDKMLADVKAALIQQDILPYWHEHYMAVSFRPIGRIDIRRAYNIGALTDDDLLPSFLQLGYSDENAAKMVEFTKRLRTIAAGLHRAIKLWSKFIINGDECRQRMLKDGLPNEVITQAMSNAEGSFESSPYSTAYVRGDITRTDFTQRLTGWGVSGAATERIADVLSLRIINHPDIKRFVVGVINRTTAEDNLKQAGLDTGVSAHLLDLAETAVNDSLVVNCQRGVHKRYLMGELDKESAVDILTRHNTTSERAAKLVEWWDCERVATGKTIPAAKLCSWLARGAIAVGDFTSRLIRLGYTEESAAIMTDDCLISINAKRLAEAKKEAKEQAAESLRAQRILRRNVLDQERESTRLAVATKRAADTRKARDKQLISAGEKLHLASGAPLYDSLQMVKQQQSRIVQTYGLSIDESLAIVILASESLETGRIADYPGLVDKFATATISSGLSLGAPGDLSVSSTNGSTHPSS
jgi:hypothetical protein